MTWRQFNKNVAVKRNVQVIIFFFPFIKCLNCLFFVHYTLIFNSAFLYKVELVVKTEASGSPDCLHHNLSSFVLFGAGWQILGPTPEEQPGGQTLPVRTAGEGEPDRQPGRFPGEREFCVEGGIGRSEERAQSISEHPRQARSPARSPVMSHTCQHTH